MITLRKTPYELNGRDKQPGEPGAGPEPQKLHRRQRRARERAIEKRRPRPVVAGTGRQRLERWQREAHVELVRQGNRMGIELETKQDRKRICIELSRTQARLAGVSNATWACAKRKDRAELIARAAA